MRKTNATLCRFSRWFRTCWNLCGKSNPSKKLHPKAASRLWWNGCRMSIRRSGLQVPHCTLQIKRCCRSWVQPCPVWTALSTRKWSRFCVLVLHWMRKNSARKSRQSLSCFQRKMSANISWYRWLFSSYTEKFLWLPMRTAVACQTEWCFIVMNSALFQKSRAQKPCFPQAVPEESAL